MQKNRSLPGLIVANVILLFICLVAAGAWYWGSNFKRPAEIPASPTQSPGSLASPTARPSRTPPPSTADEFVTPDFPLTEAPPTATPAGSGSSGPVELDSGTLQTMEGIQQQVIELRGLQPAGEFTRAILTPDELRQRVIDDFFADYSSEEAVDDALVLSIFGLIDRDFDLIGLYTELFSEQVAGFYDDETREMVVIGSGGFGGPEKLTYAHEYQHALQDENWGFEAGLEYTDEACEADSERCAAIQALVEGDASLVELQWFFEYSSDTDREQVFDYYGQIESTVFDSAPDYLQQDFVFPYDQGYLFTLALFESGGWGAVDAAFDNPPVSTEQILHPEKYPGDVPVPVELPDLLPVLGEGWELLDDNVMGEWYLYLILGHGLEPGWRIADGQAAAAAAGWGGDRYQAFTNRETGEAAMVMRIVWDSDADREEFAEAFRDYAGARFPGGSQGGGNLLWEDGPFVHLFAVTGDALVWIAAPSADLAGAILAVLP